MWRSDIGLKFSILLCYFQADNSWSRPLLALWVPMPSIAQLNGTKIVFLSRIGRWMYNRSSLIGENVISITCPSPRYQSNKSGKGRGKSMWRLDLRCRPEISTIFPSYLTVSLSRLLYDITFQVQYTTSSHSTYYFVRWSIDLVGRRLLNFYYWGRRCGGWSIELPFPIVIRV